MRFKFDLAAAESHPLIRRCPECKEFFTDGEEVVRSKGEGWTFHPACSN